jgi:hypothetical protein
VADAPFEGLLPASGRDHLEWIVDAMADREGVDRIVPGTFAAFVRIHHRIHSGEQWATFAPEYLVRGVERYDDHVGNKLEFIDGDGNLDAEDVDALVPLLAAATATPAECHYALWRGWGWVFPGPMHRRSTRVWSSDEDAAAGARALQAELETEMAPVWSFAAACPVEPWWGGRDMILFDGSVDAVAAIGWPGSGQGSVQRQCPQWWWPRDRAWFVGTDIDQPWTYVAGSGALIDAVLASPQWESVAVEPVDRW